MQAQRASRTDWFSVSLEHAAPHLVKLDGLEQCLEVAFAESLIALALDELEKDRPELVFA